jgi:hypothetical protein
MRLLLVLLTGVLLTACETTQTPTARPAWHKAADSEQGQLERVKTICRGRAAQTQAAAGPYWVAGAIEGRASFNACMAELGYVQ